MPKSDTKPEDTATKLDRPADVKADAPGAIPWLDLFKLAFGATGDADAAVEQADRAQQKIAARLSRGA